MRFRAAASGTISAPRFKKSADNGGPHVGNRWTNTGVLLATLSFEGETASRWQQVLFTTPVPISAGSVYVASYLARRGRYAHDQGYFGVAYDNPPLHALADSSGGNGVFRYGTTSAFPTDTYLATNYWVDVVFDTQP